MAFQSSVNFVPGFGVIGELFDDGPYRAQPFILNSTDPTTNIFGSAFTVNGVGAASGSVPGVLTVTAGGTGSFAGYLVNPKGSTTSGTVAGGSLAPTLTLPNGSIVEILNMGSIIVSLPAAAAIGDLVIYNTTTGALATVIPAGPIPTGFAFGYAQVVRYPLTAAGLAVIQVTQVPVSP